MKLNTPAGISVVQLDDGSLISVTGGQVDVAPRFVSPLQALGFTVASADSLTSDQPLAQAPEAAGSPQVAGDVTGTVGE